MVYAGGVRRVRKHTGGQSLLEVALMLPFLVLLIGYAVDFGYFFLVAANLTSASRNGAEYSIQGYQSPSAGRLPPAGPLTSSTSVAGAVAADLGSLLGSASLTSIEVCSQANGTSGNLPVCSSYGPAATTYSVDPDPESPRFTLQRVDITYTVQPPVGMNIFGVALLGDLKFHRQVSMRVME